MAKGIQITAIFLAIIVAGGAFFVGWLIGNDWQFGNEPKQITPTIDGIIEKREWVRSSYYNIPFYLDVDNEIDPLEGVANVDGWNYLSVAEDENNYYIAVDLCSDRTNNTEDEWFAIHLANRLPDTLGSSLAFYSLENYGYEYLFYNVSGSEVFADDIELGISSEDYYDIPIVPEMDSMEILRGSYTGDFYDIWTQYDNKNITISSNHYEASPVWLEGDFLALHFGVNIAEKFPDIDTGAFMSSLSNMQLRYRLKANMTSNPPGHMGIANEFFCAIVEHGGEPGNISDFSFLNNYNTLTFAADTIVTGGVNLEYADINSTTGMFYFSVYGFNDPDVVDPTAFEIEIDKLSLKFTTDELHYIVGTSIDNENYDIAYTFGSSDNCAENHRMFEFKIAKSEFPPLEDEFLYLNIAGYGTLMLIGTNYWMYPIFGYPFPPTVVSLSNRLQFITLDMSIT